MKTALGSLFVFAGLAGTAASAAEGPNVLLIYADDVGYGDLGSYGATRVQTPNLDRLARQGIRFTSAHATASTCTPSRYSLLTGEYAFRNEQAVILPGNAPLIIDPAKPTLASVLKQRGYRTGLVGKWHLGLGEPDRPLDWNGDIRPGPRELGFDYSFHMAATGDRVPTVYIENGRVVNLDPEDPIEVSYEGPVGDDPTGLSHPELLRVQADEQHAKTIVDGTSRIGFMKGGRAARWIDQELPDTFLRKAVEFIEAPADGPFFLYYATHENHVPRLPHRRFRGSSALGVRGDAIVQMDWGVGVLLETLERRGLIEDTLIVFTSDNGPVLYDGYYDGAIERNGDHRPAGPWRGGKYSAWEGGTRMPFLVSWPGTIAPGLSDALISQVDLLASLAALTGASLPEGRARDSRNLIDTLMGRSSVGRDHLVEQGVGLYALRQGDWKYLPPGEVTDRGGVGLFLRHPIAEPGALFFLPEDPSEQRDLASLYPAKVDAMRALLAEELGPRVAAIAGGVGLGGADDAASTGEDEAFALLEESHALAARHEFDAAAERLQRALRLVPPDGEAARALREVLHYDLPVARARWALMERDAAAVEEALPPVRDYLKDHPNRFALAREVESLAVAARLLRQAVAADTRSRFHGLKTVLATHFAMHGECPTDLDALLRQIGESGMAVPEPYEAEALERRPDGCSVRFTSADTGDSVELSWP